MSNHVQHLKEKHIKGGSTFRKVEKEKSKCKSQTGGKKQTCNFFLFDS